MIDNPIPLAEHVPPMPLKHPVETLLVFILALAVVATGLIVAVLPPLPEGAFVWGVFFLLANAYPLVLYPLFKNRRADYEFRALHFLPALMLLVWLIIELIIRQMPSAATAAEWYTWGWTLPAVVVSLVLLAWYSLHVVRQRKQRLTLITAVLAGFLVLGVGAQQWPAGQRMTAAVRSGVYAIAGLVGDEKVLTASRDREEEVWRMKMRRQERRDERIAANAQASGGMQSTLPSSVTSSSTPLIAVNTSASAAAGSSSSAAPPPKLSHTGPITEAFSVLFVAGYCATLQRRVKRRLA